MLLQEKISEAVLAATSEIDDDGAMSDPGSDSSYHTALGESALHNDSRLSERIEALEHAYSLQVKIATTLKQELHVLRVQTKSSEYEMSVWKDKVMAQLHDLDLSTRDTASYDEIIAECTAFLYKAGNAA